MKRKFQVSFHDFHLDSDAGVRHAQHGDIKLQNKELAVLTELLLHAGKLVTKEDLIKSVWRNTTVSDSSIARCISSIKTQLKTASPDADELIKMVYGRGYKFVGKVSASAAFLSEECFSVLINTSPDFILFKDDKGRWLRANQIALQTFDFQDKHWQGKTDSELAKLLPASYLEVFEHCTRSDEAAWHNKTPSRMLESIPLINGGIRHFDVVKSPLFNPDGSRNMLVIFGHDITDVLQLVEQKRLADEVLANSREAVIITDTDNNILSVNRAFTQVTGYDAQEVIGKNPRLLASGRHDAAFFHAMWQQLNSECAWHGNIWIKNKNDELQIKWLNINTVYDRHGKLMNYIGIFSETTQPEQNNSELEFLAYHDPLTQLPNRQLLKDRFRQALASAARENSMVAICFIDLDKFKQVNDTLGHDAGDQLLKTVARRLLQSVREIDTVSRIGGDEFVILLTDLRTTDDAANLADKILNTLAKPLTVAGTKVTSSLSMGIALYPNDGQEFDLLLRMADASMYHAKNCGRNTYRFFADDPHSNTKPPL